MIGAAASAVPSASRRDFIGDFGDPVGAREVRLGDHEDAALDAEQMEDVEMLLGLRHHTVVGGNRQQHQVDTMGAREHVADEALMARHINHAGAGAVGQGEVGEAQID